MGVEPRTGSPTPRAPGRGGAGRAHALLDGSIHVLGAALAPRAPEPAGAGARALGGAPRHRDPGVDARSAGLLPRRQRDGAVAARRWCASARCSARTAAATTRAVLSGGWVAASFVPRTRSPFSGLDYGYGWFLGRARGRGFDAGARLRRAADLHRAGPGLTVAVTSDPTRPARSGGYFGDLMRLVEDAISAEAAALASGSQHRRQRLSRRGRASGRRWWCRGRRRTAARACRGGRPCQGPGRSGPGRLRWTRRWRGSSRW